MADILFVITVNWNRPADTWECLHSLMKQRGSSFKIIVVDNGSTDNSARILRDQFPEVQLIRSEKNLGFAGGFNLGIRAALEHDAGRILIINNDTIAHPDMVQMLSNRLNEDNIGVVAPLIYYHQKPDQVWSSGGNIKPLLLEPRNSHNQYAKIGEGPITRTFLSGCCLMVKRQVLDQVGLFDERFFLYYEDLDFSLRVMQSGWKMQIEPSAKLWHKVSVSSGGELSENERYYMALSSGKYFKKHITHKNAWAIIPYRASSAILWTFRLAFKNKWKAISAHWRGLFKGWSTQ